MKMITGTEVSGFLKNVLAKEIQEQEFSFDLTVRSITQLEGHGKVDFSGNEFEWGQRTVLSPKRVAPDDSHGWWKLQRGQYIVRLNESISLPAGHIAIVVPHERIVQNGAYHPMLLLQSSTEHAEVLLSVSDAGIEIKENARISSLVTFQI